MSEAQLALTLALISMFGILAICHITGTAIHRLRNDRDVLTRRCDNTMLRLDTQLGALLHAITECALMIMRSEYDIERVNPGWLLKKPLDKTLSDNIRLEFAWVDPVTRNVGIEQAYHRYAEENHAEKT